MATMCVTSQPRNSYVDNTSSLQRAFLQDNFRKLYFESEGTFLKSFTFLMNIYNRVC